MPRFLLPPLHAWYIHKYVSKIRCRICCERKMKTKIGEQHFSFFQLLSFKARLLSFLYYTRVRMWPAIMFIVLYRRNKFNFNRDIAKSLCTMIYGISHDRLSRIRLVYVFVCVCVSPYYSTQTLIISTSYICTMLVVSNPTSTCFNAITQIVCLILINFNNKMYWFLVQNGICSFIVGLACTIVQKSTSIRNVSSLVSVCVIDVGGHNTQYTYRTDNKVNFTKIYYWIDAKAIA